MNTHTARTKRERPLTGLRGWLIQWQVLVHLYPNFPGSHATNNSSNIEYCDKNDTILKLSSCYLHYTSFQNVRRIDNINRYFVNTSHQGYAPFVVPWKLVFYSHVEFTYKKGVLVLQN